MVLCHFLQVLFNFNCRNSNFHLQCQHTRQCVSAMRCDTGWTYHNFFCYKQFTSQTRWGSSKYQCRKSEGSLVSLTNEKEEKFLDGFAYTWRWWTAGKVTGESSSAELGPCGCFSFFGTMKIAFLSFFIEQI